MYTYTYIHIYIYIYTSVYIYIERERDVLYTCRTCIRDELMTMRVTVMVTVMGCVVVV